MGLGVQAASFWHLWEEQAGGWPGLLPEGGYTLAASLRMSSSNPVVQVQYLHCRKTHCGHFCLPGQDLNSGGQSLVTFFLGFGLVMPWAGFW